MVVRNPTLPAGGRRGHCDCASLPRSPTTRNKFYCPNQLNKNTRTSYKACSVPLHCKRSDSAAISLVAHTFVVAEVCLENIPQTSTQRLGSTTSMRMSYAVLSHNPLCDSVTLSAVSISDGIRCCPPTQHHPCTKKEPILSPDDTRKNH